MTWRKTTSTSVAGTFAGVGLSVGLLSGPAVYVQADAGITPFKYEAPQSAFDDLENA
jgi:hypothetical protein